MVAGAYGYAASHYIEVSGSKPVRIISAETIVAGRAIAAPVYIMQNLADRTFAGSMTGIRPYLPNDSEAAAAVVTSNGSATLMPGLEYVIYASASLERGTGRTDRGWMYGLRVTTQVGDIRRVVLLRETVVLCLATAEAGNPGCDLTNRQVDQALARANRIKP